jgi:drug/metabolite transporter (DMT)-like permease
VVSDKVGRDTWGADAKTHRTGVLWAVVGTVFISIGYVLSKLGMSPEAGDVDPFSATVVRMAGASALTLLACPLLGKASAVAKAFVNGRAMAIIVTGVVIGPVLGIWCSMMAMKYTLTGVAIALVSTSPIFMIPIAYAIFRDRPTLRSLAGTILAVAGVAVLMLR